MTLDEKIEDLVALRLDKHNAGNVGPLSGLILAAEAVVDMEAPRFRDATNFLASIPPSVLDHNWHEIIEAIRVWAQGDLLIARELLAKKLKNLNGSRALLAGFLAHMADFYLGNDEGMLETGRDLVELRPTMSRRAVGLSEGLFAFALEECGHYFEAMAFAQRALSINHNDVYALHAKVHVLQSVNKNSEALATISNYSTGWGVKEPMRIHMWWHYALSLINEGDLDRVLSCYDLEVRRKSKACAWEDLDAVSLLWRLDLLGDDALSEKLITRWRLLAKAWEPYTTEPNYIFNDLHAAMTFAKVEQHCLFSKVVASCRARESPDFFHSVCLPLFTGIAAFAERDYPTAARTISHVLGRPQLQVGGSKLQQNIFHSTRDVADLLAR